MPKSQDSYIADAEMDIINKEANENAAQDYIRIHTSPEELVESRSTKY
ncbi:hypothetical protein SAMN05660649_02464 [Desulfotomaculum arcticum]|uniref:Uncharacterized protein n=1 Tax=Desulfotruncus arcticus DSM 17038 TaxID=1121424 RepID=A0A1I2U2I8_9FIRM|nr:hypothetical protein [Desulfotruncus arcticus]SFG71274.1 hypothetical protein SAMN05660649_02464 [Desulfotomaculum arcticum] [Desulfotruncus arcticus DSM 17038]